MSRPLMPFAELSIRGARLPVGYLFRPFLTLLAANHELHCIVRCLPGRSLGRAEWGL
jgi:hypothetical protein